jgi:hypothetical protein
MMGFFEDIKRAFIPAHAIPLAELSKGMCVLPIPIIKVKSTPKPPPADMYVIDEDRNEFGFHTATAVNQNSGSVPHLTGYDTSMLKERQLWGGKGVVVKNEQCKAHWHIGKTVKESAAMLALSASWVEKRYGTFSAALLQETAEQ